MRKLLLLTTALFLTLNLWAQSQASDIVYPINGDSAILNCQIHDIKDGNVVFFAKDGKELVMQAVAIKRNGAFANLKALDPSAPAMSFNGKELLWEGYNHDHYTRMLKSAYSSQTFGAILIGVGVIAFFGGYQTALNAGYNETTGEFEHEDEATKAGLLMIVGVVAGVTGIPVTIVGGVKAKKAKIGLEKTKPQETSLQFGATPNGIGLVMKF